MFESILAEIDAEVARLQSVKALLNSADTTSMNRKPGKPAKAAKKGQRHTMSAEARERIRQAQIRRWAKARKPGASLSRSKRKSTKKAA